MIRHWLQRGILVAIALHLSRVLVLAQVTPSRAIPPPDDTPSVRVGGTIFLDYTHTSSPKSLMPTVIVVSPSSFNVARTYINVTGQLNHLFAFRITPDISRETSGSSLSGSTMFRLKYGFVQFNLDDWLWRDARNSYVRFGMIQTPYVEFEESVYRYRFQGPVFVDRERFLTSADFGLRFARNSSAARGSLCRHLQRGGVQPRRSQRPEGISNTRYAPPVSRPGAFRGLRVTPFTTTIITSRTPSVHAS